MANNHSSKLGDLFRFCRLERHISQLAMSIRLDVSQRHISYIENGRAKPSRNLLLRWMHEVDASPALENAALYLADLAPIDNFPAKSPETGERTSLIWQQVFAGNPSPTINLSWDMTVLDLNDSAKSIFQIVMPQFWKSLSINGGTFDLIEAMKSPLGLFSRMIDPGPVAATLLAELYTRIWIHPSLRTRVASLGAYLERNYEIEAHHVHHGISFSPLRLKFNTSQGVLSFWRIHGLLGSRLESIPPTAAWTELWLPADDHTRRFCNEHGGYWAGPAASTESKAMQPHFPQMRLGNPLRA